MAYQRYSPDFKKSAVEKLLGRGTRPVAAIIVELDIPSPTFYQWKLDLAKVDVRARSIFDGRRGGLVEGSI